MADLPRVVLHVDGNGNATLYADPGVTVFSVYDPTPQDRVYLCDPAPIPAGMLDGPTGFAGDGSPAEKVLSKFVKEAFGIDADPPRGRA